jgi:hypothetical protein
MQNLEQIRARSALKFSKEGVVANVKGGEIIKKTAPMVQNHGLLATCAFSFGEKEGGWKKVFDAIAKHLVEIGVLPSERVSDRLTMLEFLISEEASSETLKLATNETMAWLLFASRFVKKNDAGT